MLFTPLLSFLFGVALCAPIVNNALIYTWNLWLSGFENVANLVISGKFPTVRKFLQNVNIDASLTEAEAERRIKDWVGRQDQGIQSQYRYLEDLLVKIHQNLVNVARSGFNTLSPQAQNVVREIQRIENNKYLAIRDEQSQIDNILTGITYNIQSELRQFDQKVVQIIVNQYGMPQINGIPVFNVNGNNRINGGNQNPFGPYPNGQNILVNTGNVGSVPNVGANTNPPQGSNLDSWGGLGDKQTSNQAQNQGQDGWNQIGDRQASNQVQNNQNSQNQDSWNRIGTENQGNVNPNTNNGW
ncbi:hypothetical protein L596_009645 [Steinernema carpocapsae]|uniref:SXP/RAL-2 family protein Ani s 5-like cation-binding domain-containing protein n=1 Tax=Steinernema carpocapsae TaxID=34508 RepID=A0A4U5PG92_STECR|nr:hypothetical protein L596_009645 [Steinernema carpocapsae]